MIFSTKTLIDKIDAMDVRLDQIYRSLAKEKTPPTDHVDLPPDKFISKYYERLPENDLYEALYGGSEPLQPKPNQIGLGSTLCRQLHFSFDEFRFWMKAMGIRPRLHRKDWEWFYIAQSLFESGMLAPGKKGLGFAVGREPLPCLFASYGCEILATDQAPEQAVQSGWATSGQYSDRVENLFKEGVCDREKFFSLVKFASMDMNAIPASENGAYDFCWSSCSLEHLGSLEHGLRFVENAMNTLRPGGIAIHTTEFNLSSNDKTIENEQCSFYRRRDIENLATRLEASGYKVSPFDWTVGGGLAETVVDLPPYKQSPHLRLKVGEIDATSVGIIARKSA